MLKSYFLVCCFLILLHHGHAQLYPFTLFNTSNGLINNRCGNISQDSAGYIWIGTDNGICNYDGRKFNFFPGHFNTFYFGQSQPNIYNGSCLLGASNGGLAKCAGNKVEFLVPSAKNNGHIISGMALNDSTYLIARYGNTKKLLLLSGKQEKELSIPSIIGNKMSGFLLLFQDAEKNIWVGTQAGIVVFLKGDFEKPYVIAQFLHKYVNCIKEDFEHNIFISSNGGVYKIAREQLKDIVTASPLLFYQSKSQVTSLGFLTNGDIIVSPISGGVKVFSGNLQWIRDINSSNGLNNTVWDIFTDREGNTWFATDNGLLKLKGIDFVYYKSPAATSSSILSGDFYKGSFVFSDGTSILQIRDGKDFLLAADNEKELVERILVAPGDELWANTYWYATVGNMLHSTFKHSIETGKQTKKEDIRASYHLTSPVNMEQAINLVSGSMLFLTEDKKLWLASEKKIKPLQAASMGIPSEFSLLAKGNNKNGFWALNTKKGLYQYRIQAQNNSVFFSAADSVLLPAEILKSCSIVWYSDNETLWLGTYNQGVFVYGKDSQQRYVLKKKISTPDISSVMITALLQDSTGNMWVGTNNGVDKINFSKDGAYNFSKGVFDNTLNGKMIFFLKEKNNQLYIGTTGSLGIAKIKPAEKTVAPIVHINHLSINNKNVDSLLAAGEAVFEPDENNISFEFVALSFINEKQTVYQYKLEGADTAWSPISPNYSITYNQLKPGQYTLRVRARNAENTWSDKDASFSFAIKKPFYKHWAFYCLCAGICCGFAYWLYRQKIAGILAVERTRQHISKDLHDDIGSTLSSITLMNAVLKNKIEKKPDEAAKLAEKIEDTSRQMIQNMSDIVWSINPGNDTMEKLQNRLQQFCADIFEETDTLHKLIFSDTLVKKSLPMQLRRDVYLICKELTNNAAKYSRAQNYTLTLSLDNKNILIEAADDGVGFDNTSASAGNGLGNIKQRVAANKGEVLLDTSNGTRWNIKIPMV